MPVERSPQEQPSLLPADTQVGDWRVVDRRGQGAYGVVYRAVRVGQEAAGMVAFKLALYPWDPRFLREGALLSLIHHPSVPPLLGHGFWMHPSGMAFPFVVMEWIEGMSLYDWAREHAACSRQVLRVLAQLARALEATHACRAVHRDVKGDNVLVRRSDGRAVLIDFGSGHYPAAARVTWQPLPPGTPAYQSPEAGLFQLRTVRTPGAHYQARPADDVYALGVTAYRLLTGDYPPEPEPEQAEDGTWHMKERHPPAPWERNPQVEPALGALILRMLSLVPEARGTAGELAEALEAAAGIASQERAEAGPPGGVPEARQPVRALEAGAPGPELPARTAHAGARGRFAVGGSGLVLAAVGVLLAFCTGLAVRVRLEAAPWGEPTAPRADEPHDSPVALADLAPALPLEPEQRPSQPKGLRQGQLPKPRPGQLTPDARGQCPGSKQLPLNGGCWVEYPVSDAAECEQNGFEFFKNRCYGPAQDKRRKSEPTSAPPP